MILCKQKAALCLMLPATDLIKLGRHITVLFWFCTLFPDLTNSSYYLFFYYNNLFY
nr:MAG TPA: hypothetical protein [Bacteriophage sp.]